MRIRARFQNVSRREELKRNEKSWQETSKKKEILEEDEEKRKLERMSECLDKKTGIWFDEL
jgi:hypothetical protein